MLLDSAPTNLPHLKAPDSVPVSEFLFPSSTDTTYENSHGRYPLHESLPPFTCGVTGTSYTAVQVRSRIESLATGLSHVTGWKPNEGSEWDKVVGVYSFNNIDYYPVSWAVHRLSGISAPTSTLYSLKELVRSLVATKCKALFTCEPLLETALQAAEQVGIPRNWIFLIDVPDDENDRRKHRDIKTVDELIDIGENGRCEKLEVLRWSAGQGARQPAFLCSSSGTSGLPKSVIVTHHNIITNCIQFSQTYHGKKPKARNEMILGLLPQSHSFALVLLGHTSVYQGDGVVVYQGFDLLQILKGIAQFRISVLCLVPPMVVGLLKASNTIKNHDLSSVTTLWVGAATLTKDTLEKLNEAQPSWTLLQGYGLTKACILAINSPSDIWYGSCGALVHGVTARLISPTDGTFITDYDTPGELLIRSDSTVPGYLDNEAANEDLYFGSKEDGWLRTGDLCLFQRRDATATIEEGVKPADEYFGGPGEYLFIIDRVKELIKVKGMQVAPAELEAYLTMHSSIAEACVIPIPDPISGEVPFAFIVKSKNVGSDSQYGAPKDDSDEEFKQMIHAHMTAGMASFKKLQGGIEFVEELPKSSSGKVMRKILKEQYRELVGRQASGSRRQTIEQVQVESNIIQVPDAVAAMNEKTAAKINIEVFEFVSDDDDD